jgi:hypothetical protein
MADFQTTLNGDVSRAEYALGSVRTLRMIQTFAISGLDYFAKQESVIIKMPRDVVIDLIRKNLLKLVDNDPLYTTRLTCGQFLTTCVLTKKLTTSNVQDIRSIGLEVLENILANNDEFVVDFQINGESDNDWYYDDPPSNLNDTDGDDIVLSGTITVQGVRSYVKPFLSGLLADIKDYQRISKTSLVNWLYMNGERAARDTFLINKTWDIKDSYYPWINGSVENYYKQFLSSNAQILVAFGPPGTGKTSWIRDFLCESNLNAFISYDTQVLQSDSTFVSYLTDPLYNAIILEDADELLTGSRADNNKVIAKILNISDGLIKLPRKKLIFSSNLNSIKDIDSAIIRPGRCFDVLEFRRHTESEAQAVANDLGIKLPGGQKDYSLAELFGLKVVREASDPLMTDHGTRFSQKMGFLSS